MVISESRGMKYSEDKTVFSPIGAHHIKQRTRASRILSEIGPRPTMGLCISHSVEPQLSGEIECGTPDGSSVEIDKNL